MGLLHSSLANSLGRSDLIKILCVGHYCNSRKYWDRWAFANSLDPDQTPQYAASDWGLHSNILDTSRGCRMDYFKF